MWCGYFDLEDIRGMPPTLFTVCLSNSRYRSLVHQRWSPDTIIGDCDTSVLTQGLKNVSTDNIPTCTVNEELSFLSSKRPSTFSSVDTVVPPFRVVLNQLTHTSSPLSKPDL